MDFSIIPFDFTNPKMNIYWLYSEFIVANRTNWVLNFNTWDDFCISYTSYILNDLVWECGDLRKLAEIATEVTRHVPYKLNDTNSHKYDQIGLLAEALFSLRESVHTSKPFNIHNFSKLKELNLASRLKLVYSKVNMEARRRYVSETVSLYLNRNILDDDLDSVINRWNFDSKWYLEWLLDDVNLSWPVKCYCYYDSLVFIFRNKNDFIQVNNASSIFDNAVYDVDWFYSDIPELVTNFNFSTWIGRLPVSCVLPPKWENWRNIIQHELQHAFNRTTWIWEPNKLKNDLKEEISAYKAEDFPDDGEKILKWLTKEPYDFISKYGLGWNPLVELEYNNLISDLEYTVDPISDYNWVICMTKPDWSEESIAIEVMMLTPIDEWEAIVDHFEAKKKTI